MLINPAGLFIANMDVYAKHTPSKETYAAFSRDAQLSTVTVLNDPDSARLQRSVGVPYTVYRQSEWEPDVPHDATRAQVQQLSKEIYQAARNLRTRVGDPTIHIMVNCEQDPHPNRFLMYIYMVQEAMLDPQGPVGMVFSNAATGVLDSGFYGAGINDWAHPLRLEYLLLLNNFRHVRLASGSYAFLHGTHGYTALYPWIAVNGGEHRIHNWTEGFKFLDGTYHIDWSKPQDHLGREFQGQMLALGYRWNDESRRWIMTNPPSSQPTLPPWSLVTEQPIDAMNDVRWFHRADMTMTEEFPEPQGWRTLIETWKRPDWFPENPPAKTLAMFNEWIWNVVYGPTGVYVGTQNYASGATGPETRTHNVSPTGQFDPDYFNTIKTFRVNLPDHFFYEVPEEPKPVPAPEPPPIVPVNKDWDESYLVVVDTKLDYVNIREQPSATAPILGRLYNKSFIVRSGKTAKSADGNIWRWVVVHPALKGWVRSDLIIEREHEKALLKEYL